MASSRKIAKVEKVRQILIKVQFNKTCHKTCIKNLREIYENEFETKEFSSILIKMLKQALSIEEAHTHVTNTLELAAKFAVSLNDSSEEDNALLKNLYKFLVDHHSAKNLNIRYRICHFFQLLLNSLGDNCTIDDNLYDTVSSALMERMQDRSPKVRLQAVLALHRLQDPQDEECQVINCFLFHLSKDPNADVRKTILSKIGKNRRVLAVALKSIYDVSVKVRVAAYTFISKITVRSLTIEQREIVLKNGLKDNSEKVRECIKKVLLPTWLLHYNKNYIDLLKGLDAENALEMTIISVNSLIQSEKIPIKELLAQVEFDNAIRGIPIAVLSSQKVLLWRCLVEHFQRESLKEELEEVMPELTPFCIYIVDYMNHMKSKDFEPWESKSQEFILYQLFEMTNLYDLSDEMGRNELKMLALNTLSESLQSERIIKCAVDRLSKIISDIEMRVSSLIDVINELRMPMKQVGTRQVAAAVQLSDNERHEIKMQQARLKVQLSEYEEDEYNAIRNKKFMDAEDLQKKITELKEMLEKLSEENEKSFVNDEVPEERNDPETLTWCLGIMCNIMRFPELNDLSPNLRTLMENMALPNIRHPDKVIRKLAVISLGLCCILDGNLAKQHIFQTFFFQFTTDQHYPEICIESLKVMIDLLCVFGFEHFGIFYNEDDAAAVDRTRRNGPVRLYNTHDNSIMDTAEDSAVPYTPQLNGSKIVTFFMELLESSDNEICKTATIGLLKFMAREKMQSCQLVSRFIIQLHDPACKKDTFTLQSIVHFLNYYAQELQDSPKVLEKVFFLALKHMENCLDTTGFMPINQNKVAALILLLTDGKNTKSNYHVHNSIVHTILEEIQNPECDLDKEVLVKSLGHLKLKITSETIKREILEEADCAIEAVKDSHQQWVKFIETFKATLLVVEEGREERVSTAESA